MNTITLSNDEKYALRVAFPYDRNVVATMKEFDGSVRRYDPDTKTWLLKRSQFGPLVAALGHLFAPLDYEVLRAAYPARKGRS